MKISKKGFIALAVVLSILAGITAITAQPQAKGGYWLNGISKEAGGGMALYYKGGKFVLKGKIRKASSEKAVYSVKAKKGSYKLKIANNCRVILDEAGNRQVVSFKNWIKDNEYKDGDKISFISATLKVENKKVTRICFSA